MILSIVGMKKILLISINVFYEHFINRKGFREERDTVLFISFYRLYLWSINLIVILLTELIFLNFNLEVSGNVSTQF